MLQTNKEAVRTTIQAAPVLRTRRIRELNDQFRQFPERGLGVTGRIVCTPGISAMGWGIQTAIFQQVKSFNDFTDANDPNGEHDFGNFEFNGKRIFWKIDYYAEDMEHGSPDPTDPAVTCRVLTIMLADEY